MTRAERRARLERKKARTRRMWWWRTLTPKGVGVLATTPAPCSCWMCGNPRRHMKGVERLTMQERRVDVHHV